MANIKTLILDINNSDNADMFPDKLSVKTCLVSELSELVG